MNHIHQTVRAKALVEVFVVIVVDFWTHQQRQVKTTMLENCVREDETVEEKCCRDANLKDDGWENRRNHVTQQVLDWMAVLINSRNWCGPLMMNLVNVLVDRFVMQKAMVVVENDLVEDAAEDEILVQFVKRRNCDDVDDFPSVKVIKTFDENKNDSVNDHRLVENLPSD